MSDLSEDLAFVRRTIEEAHRALAADALPLLVWCGLTLGGIAVVYLLPDLDSIWLWLGLIGLAWFHTGYRVLQRQRSTESTGFSQRALGRVWLGVLIAMTIVGFVGPFTQTLAPSAITPIFASMFGIGCLTSASLLEGRHLSWLAGGWWAGAVMLFLVQPEWRLALFGLLLAFLLALPAWRVHGRSTGR